MNSVYKVTGSKKRGGNLTPTSGNILEKDIRR